MAVPTYDQFIEPLLRYLVENPDGVETKSAYEHLSSALSLSEEDKQALLPSGLQPIYKNRAAWAHDRLKRAGLSRSVRRGLWQISPEGIDFLEGHPSAFSDELREELAIGYKDVRLRTQSTQLEAELHHSSAYVEVSAAAASPDDRLGQALEEIRMSAESELLDLLASVSPAFFETIVLDLLHRMGYGVRRSDLQRVGGSGDAGIDGIISLDRLGLEKIYVQAKRWQENIGRPILQAFYGALAGQKAKKGIFITTSSYTSQATDFSKSVDGIVLIGGPRLVGLMIDHEVGVTSRMIKIPKIDGDYFYEETA